MAKLTSLFVAHTESHLQTTYTQQLACTVHVEKHNTVHILQGDTAHLRRTAHAQTQKYTLMVNKQSHLTPPSETF